MKLPAVLLLLLASVSGFTHEKKPVPGARRRELEEGSGDSLRRRSLGSSRHLGGSMPVPPPPPSGKGKGGDEGSSKDGKGGSVSKSEGKGKGESKSGGKGKGGSKSGGKGKGGSKSGGKGKGGSKASSKSGGKGKGGSKASSKSGGKGKGGSKASSKSGGKGKGGSKSEGKGKGGSKGSKGKGKGGSESGKGKGGSESGKGKGGSESGKGKGGSESGKGKGGSESGKGKGGPVSGKGKGAPEGKGKGVASCTVIPILFYSEDLLLANYSNAVGFGLDQVPIFDPETLAQIGVYSDFAVDIPDSDDCIASGAFSFGTQGADGKYPSQIEISFTCRSQQNAITGGSGEYGCASGYETLVFQDETAGLLGTELTVCGPLCPSA